jgi:hypothetical protein
LRNRTGGVLLATALVVFTTASLAQSICRVYEYAELRDMRREKLEQLYCDYRSDMQGMITVALADANAGHQAASRADQRAAERCAQEMERIERVLDSKFAAKAPKCQTK